MSLQKYKQRRNFEKTPEPKESRPGKKSGGLVYAIQRHEATHLHFDLRLEENGVLKSWAIPKPPPGREGIRRLAVKTEDHPLGYEDFKGIIPEGEYGAGRVETWDKGTYIQVESGPAKKVMILKGDRLSGRYCLIKLKPADPKDKNWLFFKLEKL